MYAFWVLKIAVILLVFIASVKVRLLAGVRLGTKLFYVAMVIETSLSPLSSLHLACVLLP